MSWFWRLRRRVSRSRFEAFERPEWSQASKEHRNAASSVAGLVTVGYFFPVYWAATRAFRWRELVPSLTADRLWPVAWLEWFEVEPGPWLVLLSMLAVLAGAIARTYRLGRVLVLGGLLELLALEFSYGKIHHLMHGWLFVLCLWVFLPRGWSVPESINRSGRHAMVLIFGASQLAIAGTYSLSGLGKLLGGLYQLAIGEVSVFHASSLARHVADRILQTGEPSLLGRTVVDLGSAGLLLNWGNLYFQLFAVWFALRPATHRVLGYYLVTFHLLSALVLTIDFSPMIVLAAMLFVASPFAPARQRPMDVLLSLPPLGAFQTRGRSKRSTRPHQLSQTR